MLYGVSVAVKCSRGINSVSDSALVCRMTVKATQVARIHGRLVLLWGQIDMMSRTNIQRGAGLI
jgi:hypothetical protein